MMKQIKQLLRNLNRFRTYNIPIFAIYHLLVWTLIPIINNNEKIVNNVNFMYKINNLIF